MLERLRHPVVLAPLAGGPATPALAAAVSGAGGLGFLAAGYRQPGQVRADVEALRALTDAPFGVNVFAPPCGGVDAAALAAYVEGLRRDAAGSSAAVGEPRRDDDAYADK